MVLQGSKPQLEQVWEDQDHMPKEEFNPRTFFAFHGEFLSVLDMSL